MAQKNEQNKKRTSDTDYEQINTIRRCLEIHSMGYILLYLRSFHFLLLEKFPQ